MNDVQRACMRLRLDAVDYRWNVMMMADHGSQFIYRSMGLSFEAPLLNMLLFGNLGRNV